MDHYANAMRQLNQESWPVYQFYALMANERTAPAEGLRIGACCVLNWLAARLGDVAGAELEVLAAEDPLRDCHIGDGLCTADILAIPEEGAWSCRFAEPDPGTPGQMLTVNIGFSVRDDSLECGFQTLVSGTLAERTQTEEFRPAPVWTLMRDSDFGFRSLTQLRMQPTHLESGSALAVMLQIRSHAANLLPHVVFIEPPAGQSADEERDIAGFAEKTFSFCRTYRLSAGLLPEFQTALGCSVSSGDVVVLEPGRFGGKVSIRAYSPLPDVRKDGLLDLKREITAYPRRKTWYFGSVQFLKAPEQPRPDGNAEAGQAAEAMAELWRRRLSEQEACFEEEKDALNRMIADLENRNRKLTARVHELEELLAKRPQTPESGSGGTE